MSSTAFPVARGEASSRSTPIEGARRVTLPPPSTSLPPLSASEWLIIVAFGGSLLAYVTAIGLAARWVLRWLVGT